MYLFISLSSRTWNSYLHSIYMYIHYIFFNLYILISSSNWNVKFRTLLFLPQSYLGQQHSQIIFTSLSFCNCSYKISFHCDIPQPVKQFDTNLTVCITEAEIHIDWYFLSLLALYTRRLKVDHFFLSDQRYEWWFVVCKKSGFALMIHK